MPVENATSLSTELPPFYPKSFACFVPGVLGPVRPNKGEEQAGRMISTKQLTVFGVRCVDLRYVWAGKVHIVLEIHSTL